MQFDASRRLGNGPDRATDRDDRLVRQRLDPGPHSRIGDDHLGQTGCIAHDQETDGLQGPPVMQPAVDGDRLVGQLGQLVDPGALDRPRR